MKQRRTNSGSSPVFRYIRQMENMVSKMTSENPIERIQSLERRIGEVDKIPNIENFVRQIKERMWITKEVLTISEASAYLGLSESYIYKLTASKQIPHYKPNGKLCFFSKADLDTWLTNIRIKSQAEIDSDAAQYLVNRRADK